MGNHTMVESWKGGPVRSGARHSHSLPARALVVEDNPVIAMDLADTLADVGVTDVRVVGTAHLGLEALERGEVDFGILDVSLGADTSLSIALALAGRGVPFVVTTGCDDLSALLSSFPPAPVLRKPYSSEEVLDAVEGLFRN